MTTNNRPDEQAANEKPANQTGEEKGVIKKPQQTDATMAEKDLARGSEAETHARR